jgi:integrase/recombinase XerD
MKKSVAELINGFNTYLLDNGKSDKTAKDYGRHVNTFARWLSDQGGDIAEPTRYDVQQYVKYLQEIGNKPQTIKVKLMALTAYARYIDRPEIVEDIRRPQAVAPRNIAPKSLEKNERHRLLREVERSGNLRTIAIAYMLLYTGLRVSELANLNREDVQIGERSGSVIVRSGKGDKYRTVPLAREARYHLRRYLESRQDDEPALFISNYRRRMSTRSIQRALDKYGVHPHALRHTFGRELVAKGTDIATVAEIMGHSDVNVTRRYAKPSPKDIEDAIEKAFG